MALVTLITGGARSGKSRFALELARTGYQKRVFIATAVACDEEMRQRIDTHRRERGDDFETIEQPYLLAEAIGTVPPYAQVAIIDCLTVWLGNVYHRESGSRDAVKAHIERLAAAVERAPCDLILVTNEVGWGIVPENAMARDFRDDAGYLNGRIAARADTVYCCVCGIAQVIKRKSL